MKATEVKAGTVLIFRNKPVEKLLLISKGKVKVNCPGGSYYIGAGDIAGICECFLEFHILTYEVVEDALIYAYPIPNQESIRGVLASNTNVARVFIRSCIKQISSIISSIQSAQVSCNEFFTSLKGDYKLYISSKQNEEQDEDIEKLEAFLSVEEPDYWLVDYYQGLDRIYKGEHSEALLEETDISVGMLKKGCLDARKSVLLLIDRYEFTKKCLHYYFMEDGLFEKMLLLYSTFENVLEMKRLIIRRLKKIISDAQNLKGSLMENIFKKVDECKKRLENIDKESDLVQESIFNQEDDTIFEKLTDSISVILNASKLTEKEKATFKEDIALFVGTADKNGMDDNTISLRRRITKCFNELYRDICMESLKTDLSCLPIQIQMFLYFGYCSEILAGKENSISLYKLAVKLADKSYQKSGVYTFYDWLKAIYEGNKEPSRNEFEVDFAENVRNLKRRHEITEEEAVRLLGDNVAKTEFEIDNIFKIANKITFGRISSFCPVFSSDNMLKNIEDCFVTGDGIKDSINSIRTVDYSAFYREKLDTEHGEVMSREFIHVEVIPDFILMPNAGVRGVMWQEIEGKVRTTPGRIFLSVFHMEDFNNTMLRLVAEFRWELCKRMQGARWNDVTTPSLTSQYCDYAQFYRKNNNLSSEVKEKIRLDLQRSRNSFKEMFVKDYLLYMLYESKGSIRLNKVAREIIFVNCPFNEKLCEEVGKNPSYVDLLRQRKIKQEQKLSRYEGLKRKLLKETGMIPDTLEDEMNFVRGV